MKAIKKELKKKNKKRNKLPTKLIKIQKDKTINKKRR